MSDWVSTLDSVLTKIKFSWLTSVKLECNLDNKAFSSLRNQTNILSKLIYAFPAHESLDRPLLLVAVGLYLSVLNPVYKIQTDSFDRTYKSVLSKKKTSRFCAVSLLPIPRMTSIFAWHFRNANVIFFIFAGSAGFCEVSWHGTDCHKEDVYTTPI